MQTNAKLTKEDQSKNGFRMTKKIGSTTYKVSVYFSKTSKETLSDKLARLIEQEAQKSDEDL